ncbi:hypothetical protein BDZ45DRAFT_749977 [Acephala macrosclerotiorum]|nr:hypothetical protein BDZ45DRAFT_749977 [Acephala macrosclerotiorum]
MSALAFVETNLNNQSYCPIYPKLYSAIRSLLSSHQKQSKTQDISSLYPYTQRATMCLLDCNNFTHPSCNHKVLTRIGCGCPQSNIQEPNPQVCSPPYLIYHYIIQRPNQRCDNCQVLAYNRIRLQNGMSGFDPRLYYELKREGVDLLKASDEVVLGICRAISDINMESRNRRRRGGDEDEEDEETRRRKHVQSIADSVNMVDLLHHWKKAMEVYGGLRGQRPATELELELEEAERENRRLSEAIAWKQEAIEKARDVRDELQGQVNLVSSPSINSNISQAASAGEQPDTDQQRSPEEQKRETWVQIQGMHHRNALEPGSNNDKEPSATSSINSKTSTDEPDNFQEESEQNFATRGLGEEWQLRSSTLQSPGVKVLETLSARRVVLTKEGYSTKTILRHQPQAMPATKEPDPSWHPEGAQAVHILQSDSGSSFNPMSPGSASRKVVRELTAIHIRDLPRGAKDMFWNPHFRHYVKIKGPTRAQLPWSYVNKKQREREAWWAAHHSVFPQEMDSGSDTRVHMRGGDGTSASKQAHGGPEENRVETDTLETKDKSSDSQCSEKTLINDIINAIIRKSAVKALRHATTRRQAVTRSPVDPIKEMIRKSAVRDLQQATLRRKGVVVPSPGNTPPEGGLTHDETRIHISGGPSLHDLKRSVRFARLVKRRNAERQNEPTLPSLVVTPPGYDPDSDTQSVCGVVQDTV